MRFRPHLTARHWRPSRTAAGRPHLCWWFCGPFCVVNRPDAHKSETSRDNGRLIPAARLSSNPARETCSAAGERTMHPANG